MHAVTGAKARGVPREAAPRPPHRDEQTPEDGQARERAVIVELAREGGDEDEVEEQFEPVRVALVGAARRQ